MASVSGRFQRTPAAAFCQRGSERESSPSSFMAPFFLLLPCCKLRVGRPKIRFLSTHTHTGWGPAVTTTAGAAEGTTTTSPFYGLLAAEATTTEIPSGRRMDGWREAGCVCPFFFSLAFPAPERTAAAHIAKKPPAHFQVFFSNVKFDQKGKP